MCHSITYYFSGCLCTFRVGWYTCPEAKSYLTLTFSNTKKGIAKAVNDENTRSATFLTKRHLPIHKNCEKCKYTAQAKKCGGSRCVECISDGDGDDCGDTESKNGEVGSASDEDDDDDDDDQSDDNNAKVMLELGDEGVFVTVPPLQFIKSKTDTQTVEEKLAKWGILPDYPSRCSPLTKSTSTPITPKIQGAVAIELEVRPLRLFSKEKTVTFAPEPMPQTNRSLKGLLGSSLLPTPGKNKGAAVEGVVLGAAAGSAATAGNGDSMTGDPVKKAFVSGIPVRSPKLLSGGSNNAGGGGGSKINAVSLGVGWGIKRAKTARSMRVDVGSGGDAGSEAGVERDEHKVEVAKSTGGSACDM